MHYKMQKRARGSRYEPWCDYVVWYILLFLLMCILKPATEMISDNVAHNGSDVE